MSKEMDVTQIRTCTLSNRIPTFQGCFTLLGCTLCPILRYEERLQLSVGEEATGSVEFVLTEETERNGTLVRCRQPTLPIAGLTDVPVGSEDPFRSEPEESGIKKFAVAPHHPSDPFADSFVLLRNLCQEM